MCNNIKLNTTIKEFQFLLIFLYYTTTVFFTINTVAVINFYPPSSRVRIRKFAAIRNQKKN